jgi:hypothetical protein
MTETGMAIHPQSTNCLLLGKVKIRNDRDWMAIHPQSTNCLLLGKVKIRNDRDWNGYTSTKHKLPFIRQS